MELRREHGLHEVARHANFAAATKHQRGRVSVEFHGVHRHDATATRVTRSAPATDGTRAIISPTINRRRVCITYGLRPSRLRRVNEQPVNANPKFAGVLPSARHGGGGECMVHANAQFRHVHCAQLSGTEGNTAKNGINVINCKTGDTLASQIDVHLSVVG